MQSEDDDHLQSSAINGTSDMVLLSPQNDLEECDIQETIEMVKFFFSVIKKQTKKQLRQIYF